MDQILETLIEAKNFRVGYNDQVVLQIPELSLMGSVIALIGHNGAGKSTLIKSLLSLLPQSSGTLRASMIQLSQSTELVPHQHMAFCPEEGAVFADISVEHYVKLWCRLKHGDALYYTKQGAQFIELLSLAPLLSKLGRELSKGQRRRVQTAIGFLCAPKLFLFDEPFDGLDVQKTTELSQIIRQQVEHTSFIVSSHRMDVVERSADAVIVLQNGRVASSGRLNKVCAELCKASFVVRNADDAGSLARSLSSKLEQCIVDEVDGEIRIFSNSLKAEELTSLIRGHKNANGFYIEECSPSLVDAMNLHLKTLV